jgi:hypothetical protein
MGILPPLNPLKGRSLGKEAAAALQRVRAVEVKWQ